MTVTGHRQKFCTLFVSLALLCGSASTPRARDFPHQAEVIKIEELNHNIRRIRLKPQHATQFVFTPGQHVFLRAPQDYLAEFNKRYKTSHKVSRPYSFASSPSRHPYSDLIIKRYDTPPGKDVPPGVVSTLAHKYLKVGDTVSLSDPSGQLYARDDSDRPIVLVAGGVGVAPFVCLMNYWFENKIDQQRKIYFFFGVRSKRDLILHDQFTMWNQTKKNFHYIPALSDPQQGDDWKGETGYINVVLDKYFSDPFDADAYLAGPPIMIRFTRKVLEAKGITGDRIHQDPIQVE